MSKPSSSFRLNNKIRVPLKIVLVYIVVGSIWIAFSDQAVAFLEFDHSTEAIISTLKGWLYVAVTALLLFWLIRKNFAALQNSQKKLWESEQLFRDMANGAPVMLWMSDSQGAVYFFNRQWLAFTGRTIEQELNNGWLENIHPEDLAGFESTYRAAHQTRQYFETEVRLKQAGQEEFRWMLATGTPRFSDEDDFSGFVGSCLDITERKEAEEVLQKAYELLEQRVVERTAELERAKDRLQAIFNHSGDGILLLDLEQGIQQANLAFEELFKLPADCYKGAKLATLFKEGDAARIDASIQKVAETRGVERVEARIERADGSGFDVEINIAPMNHLNGTITSLVCIVHDVTERKQAEEMLRQALAQEKELGELKTRFVSMASHEFRTPLATIMALTESLSKYRGRMTEEQIEQRFDKIKAQVGHLRDIMEDVLLLARMQSRRMEYNPAWHNIDTLCRDVLDEFQSRPDITHHLNYESAIEVREVRLDLKLMHQVISNLITNAIKYSPDEETIEIRLAGNRDAWSLSVRDHGIGIPEADLKHLFEPFHRASNVGVISGTGLGLVIARELVELHGGTITMQSEVDAGTTAIVQIPVRALEKEASPERTGTLSA